MKFFEIYFIEKMKYNTGIYLLYKQSIDFSLSKLSLNNYPKKNEPHRNGAPLVSTLNH